MTPPAGTGRLTSAPSLHGLVQNGARREIRGALLCLLVLLAGAEVWRTEAQGAPQPPSQGTPLFKPPGIDMRDRSKPTWVSKGLAQQGHLGEFCAVTRGVSVCTEGTGGAGPHRGVVAVKVNVLHAGKARAERGPRALSEAANGTAHPVLLQTAVYGAGLPCKNVVHRVGGGGERGRTEDGHTLQGPSRCPICSVKAHLFPRPMSRLPASGKPSLTSLGPTGGFFIVSQARGPNSITAPATLGHDPEFLRTLPWSLCPLGLAGVPGTDQAPAWVANENRRECVIQRAEPGAEAPALRTRRRASGHLGGRFDLLLPRAPAGHPVTDLLGHGAFIADGCRGGLL